MFELIASSSPFVERSIVIRLDSNFTQRCSTAVCAVFASSQFVAELINQQINNHWNKHKRPDASLTRSVEFFYIIRDMVVTRLRESTKHGPLVHGPPPWTRSMDQVHEIIWTGSVDPLFLLPLKLVVIKDYECYSCDTVAEIIIFANSWNFTDNIKSPALRNLNLSEESPQMDRPKIVSDFVFYFKLVLHQVLEAGSANISIRVPVYPWFIINKHNVTDSNISSPDLHHFLVLADFYKSWLQSTLPSIRFWPSLDTELFLKVDKCNQNIAKAIPFFFRLLSNTFSDFGSVGRKRKKKAEKKGEVWN